MPANVLSLTERMRRIRKKDTGPELIVRRLVHAMGYRYRLHRHDLPGSPDLVFGARCKAIFVHGCFWHQHNCKLGRKKPSINTSYWHPKLARNVERDRQNLERLNAIGWDTLVIWECETRSPDGLADRVAAFLGPVRWSRT